MLKNNTETDSVGFYNTFQEDTLEIYRNVNSKSQECVNIIIINMILKKSLTSMLDIGCGDGVRSGLISGLSGIKRVRRIDNCENMIRVCERNGFEAKKQSAEHMCFQETFDVILCLGNVLGHSFNKKLILENIHKYMNENGVAFIEINNRYNFKKYRFSAMFNIIKDLCKIRCGNFRLPTGHYVYIHSPFELDEPIENLFDYTKIYFDHNGRKTNFLFGQLLYILKKK